MDGMEGTEGQNFGRCAIIGGALFHQPQLPSFSYSPTTVTDAGVGVLNVVIEVDTDNNHGNDAAV